MKERVYIRDIKRELQYKDRRSVLRWCLNNNVRVLSDLGSYKQFVLRDEFEKAINNNYRVIQGLKYPLGKISSLNTYKKDKVESIYEPKGELEKEFLSIFTDLIPSL